MNLKAFKWAVGALTLNLVALSVSPALAGFTPPSGLGAPPTTGGGVRSGSCSPADAMAQPGLSSLVPAVSPEGDWSVTTREHPDFFVYVPAVAAESAELVVAEFVVRDNEWNEIYRSSVELPEEAGIVKISLPETEKGLEVGTQYRWHFALNCAANERGISNEIAVEGWTQRVEASEFAPSLVSELDTTTDRDLAELYADRGIWHEAVSTLAQLRAANPDDATLATQWNELLETAGLSHLVELPLLTSASEF
ncbi:MAG: DUF928 domain-containing protein [Cyanobacteriota bacterium]|nr:DUF928 domain-containing protein [Cyanobacteriota bacterium]